MSPCSVLIRFPWQGKLAQAVRSENTKWEWKLRLNIVKLNLAPPVGRRCGRSSKSWGEEGNQFLFLSFLDLNRSWIRALVSISDEFMDQPFFDASQAEVNHWIQSMRNVTQLNRFSKLREPKTSCHIWHSLSAALESTAWNQEYTSTWVSITL